MVKNALSSTSILIWFITQAKMSNNRTVCDKRMNSKLNKSLLFILFFKQKQNISRKENSQHIKVSHKVYISSMMINSIYIFMDHFQFHYKLYDFLPFGAAKFTRIQINDAMRLMHIFAILLLSAAMTFIKFEYEHCLHNISTRIYL